MKIGEHWKRHGDGSVWKIIRLTPDRYNSEEGVELICTKPDDLTSGDTAEERLLSDIFGNRFNTGDYDFYTRTVFLRMFHKVY